jgi:hypothetical protein
MTRSRSHHALGNISGQTASKLGGTAPCTTRVWRMNFLAWLMPPKSRANIIICPVACCYHGRARALPFPRFLQPSWQPKRMLPVSPSPICLIPAVFCRFVYTVARFQTETYHFCGPPTRYSPRRMRWCAPDFKLLRFIGGSGPPRSICGRFRSVVLMPLRHTAYREHIVACRAPGCEAFARQRR